MKKLSFWQRIQLLLDGQTEVEIKDGVFLKVFDEKLLKVKPKVDVVICTKDRPHSLPKAVNQVRKEIPHNEIIIVESSEQPNMKVLKDLGCKLVFTPNVKLGCARQVGLEKATNDYVFFIDDDITLEKHCFTYMFRRLADPYVVGVSGRVVYGYRSNEILFNLYLHGRPPKSGGSGGLALLKRKEVLALGGYNRDIHWGEDAELCARLEKNGLKWVRELSAVGYHKCSFREALQRAKRNGSGHIVLWRFGSKTLRNIFFRLVGRTFVMPVYYMLQTLEPRVLLFYFLYNLLFLTSFLKELRT